MHGRHWALPLALLLMAAPSGADPQTPPAPAVVEPAPAALAVGGAPTDWRGCPDKAPPGFACVWALAPIDVGMAPAAAGGLDKKTIQQVIRRHRGEYRACYQERLQLNHDLAGKIVVQLTIEPNGSVGSASVLEDTMQDDQVGSCIVSRVEQWVFPAPRGGGRVVVKYPFIFEPG